MYGLGLAGSGLGPMTRAVDKPTIRMVKTQPAITFTSIDELTPFLPSNDDDNDV
jgi:hypothetical protein